LQAWLDATRAKSPALKEVFLVHGEPEAQDALAEVLRGKGYTVSVPEAGSDVTR
jgi:hypothetical protein